YGTGDRQVVRDLSKTADLPLWMSEVGGSWHSGFNPASIDNGLGIASRIQNDLRELEPTAWVLWQPIEDLYNMQPQGEDSNWGAMYVDFDCIEVAPGVWKSQRRIADADGDPADVPECGIQKNSKFATLQNFTHFIRPGDSIIPTDSDRATAAVNADGGRRRPVTGVPHLGSPLAAQHRGPVPVRLRLRGRHPADLHHHRRYRAGPCGQRRRPGRKTPGRRRWPQGPARYLRWW